MWIEWTIAIRFLREGKAQTLLILIGIAVGVAVIVFLSALIAGLQANIVERTLGTQAHIKVERAEEVNVIVPPPEGSAHLVLEDKRAQRLRSINNWQQVRDSLDSFPRVVAVSPLVTGPAFARRGDALASVALMGVDARRYQRIVPIQDDIVAGQFRIEADDAVIGKQLAHDLGLRVGHKLRLDGGQGRESIVNVTGIFELGVRELDARYVFLNMKRAQSLLDLPGAATTIDLKVDDIFDAEQIATRIARLTGLKTESWIATNSQLVNALSSQRIASRMINVFVALSVALGIASVLSVSVVQRTREIGILRAMGMRRPQVLRVFLLQGALLGLIGSLIGGLAGLGLVTAFNEFGPRLFFIPLPPVLLLAASALATLTGLLSAAVPARRASGLDPVEAIRHV
ncbi:MAG TPA: FtsX-like permease family protein [Pusillimonas sp.]|uniref:ABC transporter permease n=1 Tax=unclassified Pusillimonas TaxID=2640016 RepID=UPI00261687D8|nr:MULTISPECIES: FtsX-like permease family protein [unclassified Pusillimonas]HLU20547.1 FtsX-like permease family protein [Pusillimonas sp.]